MNAKQTWRGFSASWCCGTCEVLTSVHDGIPLYVYTLYRHAFDITCESMLVSKCCERASNLAGGTAV
jgi:hypothetical protein